MPRKKNRGKYTLDTHECRQRGRRPPWRLDLSWEPRCPASLASGRPVLLFRHNHLPIYTATKISRDTLVNLVTAVHRMSCERLGNAVGAYFTIAYKTSPDVKSVLRLPPWDMTPALSDPQRPSAEFFVCFLKHSRDSWNPSLIFIVFVLIRTFISFFMTTRHLGWY